MSFIVKVKPLPDLQILKDSLEIDLSSPSGLRWKTRPAYLFRSQSWCDSVNQKYANKPAGTLTAEGYFTVSINKNRFFAHRIIYALQNGVTDFNGLIIDHIDRNKSNNNPSNLKLVTFKENLQNKNFENRPPPKNNRSGYTNIGKLPSRGKWNVRFKNNEGRERNKSFDKLEWAVEFQKSVIEYGWEG